MKKNSGFTLIELIIVVAIIGLLAAALFVAVDPAKRIGQANDAQRWSEVTAILNAILNYTADVQTIPSAVSSLTAGVYAGIGDGGLDTFGCSVIGGGPSITEVDFSGNLVGAYLASIPRDPTHSSSTGYYILKSSANRLTVGACDKTSYTTGSLEVTR